MTTEQAATILGVPETLIATWKHRRRITPVRYIRGRGRDAPVYLIEELLPLAEQWHNHAATRREPGPELAPEDR